MEGRRGIRDSRWQPAACAETISGFLSFENRLMNYGQQHNTKAICKIYLLNAFWFSDHARRHGLQWL